MGSLAVKVSGIIERRTRGLVVPSPASYDADGFLDLIAAIFGGAGWVDDGGIVRLVTAADKVAVGAAVMFGAEKLRLVGDLRIEGFGRSTSGFIAQSGSPSIPLIGDVLGFVEFEGYDGAVFRTAAIVRAELDAAAGAADMPGRLVFLTTPDGSSTPVERLRIDKDGLATLNANPISSTSTRLLHRQASVRAKQSAGTALTSGAYVALAFGAADQFDTDGLHDPVTNNSRLTASVTGKWMVTGGAQISADPATFALQIRKNGATEYAVNTPRFGGAGGVVSALVDLAAGDYVELLVFVDSPGISSLTGDRTFFSMFLVGS